MWVIMISEAERRMEDAGAERPSEPVKITRLRIIETAVSAWIYFEKKAMPSSSSSIPL